MLNYLGTYFVINKKNISGIKVTFNFATGKLLRQWSQVMQTYIINNVANVAM